MIDPLVSVIVASYNHAKYIEKAILSVLTQSIGKEFIQLIVVDDFSTDESVNVIEALSNEYRFVFIKNSSNLGLNKTLKIAESHAIGTYTCYLASDDFFLPNKLERQLKFLASGCFDAVYSCADIYDEAGEFISNQNLSSFHKSLAVSQDNAFSYTAIDDTNGPLLQSAIIKTAIICRITELRDAYRSDDWVVILFLLKNYNVGFINESLIGYRLHASNTHKHYWKMFSYRIEVISIYLASENRELMSKSFSNLFLSQASSLVRNKQYLMGLKFALASLLFGVPYNKAAVYIKRKLGF